MRAAGILARNRDNWYPPDGPCLLLHNEPGYPFNRNGDQTESSQ